MPLRVRLRGGQVPEHNLAAPTTVPLFPDAGLTPSASLYPSTTLYPEAPLVPSTSLYPQG